MFYFFRSNDRFGFNINSLRGDVVIKHLSDSPSFSNTVRVNQNNYLDAASKGASELVKYWGAEDDWCK